MLGRERGGTDISHTDAAPLAQVQRVVRELASV